jgi:hypothetical protein
VKRSAGNLLLMVLAFAGAPALAQTALTPPDLPTVPATVRQVEVDMTGEILYDSNVARSDQELATERGLTLSDEIFTPTGVVDLALPVGRSSLFLDGSAGYDFYANNHSLDRERINVLGGGISQFGPCRETLSGTYARFQTDLSDIGEFAGVTNTENQESVATGATCGRAIGLAPNVQVSESWEQNSAQLRQLVDNRVFMATGGLAYQRPALGAVSLFGEYLDTTFPNQVYLLGAVRQTGGYQLYAGGLRYDRHLGARIQGVVSLSYTSLTPNIAGSGGFKGFTYSGDITYRASSRLNGRVSFTRATTPSNTVGANFSVDNTELAEVIYDIGPRLSLTLGGSRLARRYNVSGFNPFGAPFLITDETIVDGYITATYKLNRRLSFILNLRQEQRDANISAFNYQSSRVGLTVKGTF